MRRIVLAVLVLLLAAPALAADEAAKPAAEAVIKDQPAAYALACAENARRHMTGPYTGDAWTWHARFPMHNFIDAYLATRDTAWLDAAVQYFDSCLKLLATGPDGLKGWLGPAYRMPGRLGEYPVQDILLLEPMTRFAALVTKDEPALAEKYGKVAGLYVELTETLAFQKWEKRGIWHESGPYGAFTHWPWTFTEEAPGRWQAPPPDVSDFTLPVNMQAYWGVAALRLYRITGRDLWRDKAERIFRLAKSRLNLYDDHYAWNYWEPFGLWDLKPGNLQEFSSWINTHPYVNYQAGEVTAFVEAYHHGLVFDEQDMRRLVRTNLHVMWNGKLDDPQWNNSDAGVQKAALGEIRRGTPKPDGKFAGALWTALVPFDATARALYEKQLAPGSIEYAYYHRVTARTPPGYQRRHAELQSRPFDFPFHPCSTITMAAVIPAVIERGQYALVACQGRTAGDLRVELRGDDGQTAIAVLKEAPLKLIVNHIWDTSGVKPGRYRVRWTLKNEYREFPIEVR